MPRKATPHPLDIPEFLRVTPAEAERRRKYWVDNPPKAMPLFQEESCDEDPASAALRAQMKHDQSERRRLREQVRKENRKPHKDFYYCQRRRCMIYGFPPPPVSSAPGGISVSYNEDRAIKARPAARERTDEPRKAKNMDKLAERLKQYLLYASPQGHSSPGFTGQTDRAKLRRLAEANGVWLDRYAELDIGLARMTIGNRLRALMKRGEELTWP